MKNNRMRLGVSLLVFALSWLPTKADDEFREKLQPLFAQHCVKCHGGDKVKGKVNLKEIGNARQFLGKPALIKELIDVLDAGLPRNCRALPISLRLTLPFTFSPPWHLTQWLAKIGCSFC